MNNIIKYIYYNILSIYYILNYHISYISWCGWLKKGTCLQNDVVLGRWHQISTSTRPPPSSCAWWHSSSPTWSQLCSDLVASGWASSSLSWSNCSTSSTCPLPTSPPSSRSASSSGSVWWPRLRITRFWIAARSWLELSPWASSTNMLG